MVGRMEGTILPTTQGPDLLAEWWVFEPGRIVPAIAYFRAILKELDVRPSNVLFIDDHQANVDSAREAGLHATEFKLEAGPDQLIRTLGEFGIPVVQEGAADRRQLLSARPSHIFKK